MRVTRLGHQIRSDYLVALAKEASHFGVTFPDLELVRAPINSPEGQRYLSLINAGINCALANCQLLTYLTREAFWKIIPSVFIETLYDVSYNTCMQEE